jgi:hypothetical protein
VVWLCVGYLVGSGDYINWQSIYLFYGYLVAQAITSTDSLFIYLFGHLVGLRRSYQLTVYIIYFMVSCWAQAITSSTSVSYLFVLHYLVGPGAIISTDSLFIYFMGILLGSGDCINWQSIYLFIRSILLGSGDYINWHLFILFFSNLWNIILVSFTLYHTEQRLYFMVPCITLAPGN